VNLPQDLIDFLKSGKQLEYDIEACEAGRVKLKHLEQLFIEDFQVDSENSPLADFDPNAGEKGYYAVSGVSLLAEAEDYDPSGILLWLPQSRVFATWDCDHWNLLGFPGVNWRQIVNNPLPYLNAQWRKSKEIKVMYLAAWENYPFHIGRT
jgi:hypothetical protein